MDAVARRGARDGRAAGGAAGEDPRAGTAWNPPNRFENIEFVPDLDEIGDDDEPRPRTTFLRDASRSIVARNDSPDIPFTTSVNPYRGCEHGCLC